MPSATSCVIASLSRVAGSAVFAVLRSLVPFKGRTASRATTPRSMTSSPPSMVMRPSTHRLRPHSLLQTLVLARGQIVAPVFSSIEEYLGRNTQAYYDVLAEVGQGAWNPERDARPWLRFCLT